MAGPQALLPLQAPDRELPAIDGFAIDRLIDGAAKGVLAEDADDERGAAVAEGFGRPLDELGEVIEKGGFDLIFTRRLAWRLSARQATRQGEREHPAHHSTDE